jgi:hypothetical protein
MAFCELTVPSLPFSCVFPPRTRQRAPSTCSTVYCPSIRRDSNGPPPNSVASHVPLAGHHPAARRRGGVPRVCIRATPSACRASLPRLSRPGPRSMRSPHGRLPDQRPLLATMAKQAAQSKVHSQQAGDPCDLAECGLGGTAGGHCGPPASSRPSGGQKFPPPAAWAPLSIGLCSYESTSPHVQSLP